MERKDFFNFKTDLAGTYQALMKDKTPSKESKKYIKVNWLKIREMKCEPAVNSAIFINF